MAPWVPGRWWRVLEEDGTLWCETSDETEARQSLLEMTFDEEDNPVFGEPVPGRKLQRQYIVNDKEWRAVD